MSTQYDPEFLETGHEEEEKFDLADYIRRYWRYWFLFPIFLILAISAAYFYLQITPPVYKSSSSLLIKDEKKGASIGGSNDILAELSQFSGNKLLENEIRILSSKTLMSQVVKDLKLDILYTEADGLKTVQLYKSCPIEVIPEIVNPFGYENVLVVNISDSLHYTLNSGTKLLDFGKTYRNDWGVFKILRTKDGRPETRNVEIQFKDLRAVTGNALERLTVNQSNSKSTVLDLTFEDTSPQRGIDVLNKLLDVYVSSSIGDKNTEASNTLAFIEERLNLITGELGDVEQDVETYKTQRGLTDISAESQLFLQNIKENDAKLNEINIQIRVLESVDGYIQTTDDAAVAPATYMINDPVLVSLLNKFTELSLQREKYARTTQPDNPLLETITTQLASTKQAIRDNVQNLRRGLDLTRQNLEGINQRFSAGLRTIPQKEREYVGIKRQQTIKENLYLYLLEKREETALAYASTVTDSRLVDAPSASYTPVKPKKAIIGLGALGAGLAIPVLLINLLFMLNNTVQSREEVERSVSLSILGEIGKLRGSGKRVNEEIIKPTSRSAVAEQFRALRTNLQYLGDGTSKVLMFTSSIGGEGKSFVSANLGASLAYADKRVILVGADLRKPSLHHKLPVHNEYGLTNYLIGQNNLDLLIQSSGVHELFDVLSAGPLPPNPSELLSNGRLSTLISELQTRYDYVLIDSPPYGLVTDAAIIGEHTDATLYVIRFNYTMRQHLKKINQLQKMKRFVNLSIIFNAVNYGGGYGYGYGYGGYGYGYYSEENEDEKTGSKIGRLFGSK